MLEIRRILFPVDFSENSSKILPYVQSVSEKYNSIIYLLHVIEELPHWVSGEYIPHIPWDQYRKEAFKGAERILDKICKEELQGCPNFQRKIYTGYPAQEILKTIESESIDLVIMGTHGRKGIEHVFFGSVAENVVKKSPVPVLTVNPYKAPRRQKARLNAKVEIKKILFPCDLTKNCSKILPYALSAAEKYNSTIYLLHVVEDLLKWGGFCVPHPSLNLFQDEIFKEAEILVSKICEEHLQSCMNFQKLIICGDPAVEILKTIDSQKIDLVIMGTHGRKGMEHAIFGSAAETVVKKSPVPVWVINPYKI